jgi:metallophosphoesterase superfamily enzyme
MSKILIIPDMHLKPAILNMAERILACKKADKIVILGDLLDDFYAKPEDYERFWQKFMQFYREHKDQIVLLYGNHEVAYLIGRHVTGNIKAGEKHTELTGKYEIAA